MKISDHAKRTEKLFGIRAEDIHRWIDGFFDDNGFDYALKMGTLSNYDPFDHRRFRHCKEALTEAYEEFGDKYTQFQIKNVFETHIRDDYDGYLPSRADFENGTFTTKYHATTHVDELSEILDSQELADYFNGKHHAEPRQEQMVNRFSFRVILPTVLTLLLFIGVMFLLTLPHVEQAMMAQKRQTIEVLTASAASSIEHYIDRVDAGELNLDIAQQEALEQIRYMRYGENNKDYFFIIDDTPRMLMHPYRIDLTGQNLSTITESGNSDRLIFMDILQVVSASNNGFLEYLWQWNDDASVTAPKLTYVQRVDDWNWIIGTGLYLEDVESDINALKQILYRSTLFISVILVALLGYIVSQSRKTERRKFKAERALFEAKDRYRALVEASSEGYILEAEGTILYANNFLQRLVGYQDSELKSHTIWPKLFPETQNNSRLVHHLLQTFNNTSEPGEFDAVVKTKSGKLLDIIVRTSKIFFADKHGHVISFRPITRKIYGGTHGLIKNVLNYQTLQHQTVDNIRNSQSVGQVVDALNQMPDTIRAMIDTGSRPDILRRAIGSAYDASIQRFIELSIAQLGQPPVDFAFLSFGSNARHDMTLFSDQDNGIVFDLDPNDPETKTVKRYFLKLAEQVCGYLNQSGYRYCEGLIMATNPQWCLTKTEWQQNFSHWVKQASQDNVLELNVFLDIRASYGTKQLVDDIQQHISMLKRDHPAFLQHYAAHALTHEIPAFTLQEPSSNDEPKDASINLKACIRPMEIFCRLYAMKHNIHEVNTVMRLRHLLSVKEIDSHTFREMLFIFDHLWHLRFMNQIIEYTDLRQVNDELKTQELSFIEQQHLESILKRAALFQRKIRDDFLT